MRRVTNPSVSSWLAGHDDVITRRCALALGVTPDALSHALRTGRWRRVLPGIYVAQSGPLTIRQRMRVALAHGGPSAVIDAHTACAAHGVRAVPRTPDIHVAVPHGRHVRSAGFVVVRRTSAPLPAVQRHDLPVLALPESVIASAVRLESLPAVRALVAESVQRRLLTVAALQAAAASAPRRNSRPLRIALAEVAGGARSVAEAEFVALIAHSDVLPMPLLNCRLVDAAGRWLADPDAYWPAARLVHETDSMAWHLAPADWEATMRRHARLTAAGLLVVHSSPRRVRGDGGGLLRELEAAYRQGRALGPAPGVRSVEAA